jgi:hypothetical protein
MAFPSDQQIKSFARDLAKLCTRVDTKRAQGSSDPRLAAMKRLFQDKLAELAKAIGSEDGAEHLIRRYVREIQEEMARRPERDRSHRGQEEAVTLARRSSPPSVVFEGISVFGIADDLVVTCDDDWSGLTEALQQIPFGKESPMQKDAPAIVEGIDTVWKGGLALPRRQQPQRFR